jgi:hypothetical protein
MTTLPGLVASLTLQNAQFIAGINQANAQLGTLNKAVGAASAAVKNLAAGFAGAFSVTASPTPPALRSPGPR